MLVWFLISVRVTTWESVEWPPAARCGAADTAGVREERGLWLVAGKSPFLIFPLKKH